ncbi:PepSY-like domain-containing protein [Pontibacter beigongshangensis]|uniref:PepSY-like domain-containing protein n=1 Tax=Pontibacter beigongshangensis TaxID=2574733 RepID=UPI0016508EEE|nr:PepSY-like domain-containing protein [Pontibacter beigongshangensis]
MKNNKSFKSLFRFLPFLMALAVFTACDKDTIVPEGELPAEAKDYLSLHFPGQAIAQIEKDTDDDSVSFDVDLENGTQLEFTEQGACTSIEWNDKLPDSVVPDALLQYVTANYSAHAIRGWELNKTDQEAKLTNGQELKFDLDGNFLRIDN